MCIRDRGNLSEALAALGRESHAIGVDAGDRADGATQAEVARTLAKEYSAAALVSGPVDAVSDGERVALIPGGCELMGRITGTGCMQGALVAAFTAVAEPFDAAAFGAALLARAGEAEAEMCIRDRDTPLPLLLPPFYSSISKLHSKILYSHPTRFARGSFQSCKIWRKRGRRIEFSAPFCARRAEV